MLPSSLEDSTSTDVARVFGTEFAEALDKLPVGHWSGPVRSGFGVHLILVSAVEPGRRATLDEARTAVERDLLHDRTEKGKAAFYESLLAKYKVRVEAPAGQGLPTVAAQ
jgi:parvulin-like peptidyl-prolyl isomerase